MRARRIITSSIVTMSAWPTCSEPVMFGGGSVIDEWLLGPVGAAPCTVRREDIGLEPALVDARLDIARAVGRRHRLHIGARLTLIFGCPLAFVARSVFGRHRFPRSPQACGLLRSAAPENKNGPDRPADDRGRGTTCWFGVGRTAVIPRASVRRSLVALLTGAPAATRG